MVKTPSKKDKLKTPNQNGQVQIDLSKMAPWSNWTWGQKTIGGVFLTKIPNKKNQDFLQWLNLVILN